jgi:uncharacterized membrane-anchored protein
MALVAFKRGTEAQYTALATKDANVLYFCTDTGRLFLGSVAIAEGERQFDIIQKYECNVKTGIFTLVLHGDTTASYVLLRKNASTSCLLVTGSFTAATGLTTYSNTNASYVGGVLIFKTGVLVATDLPTATAAKAVSATEQAKALKILPFDNNYAAEMMAWSENMA